MLEIRPSEITNDVSDLAIVLTPVEFVVYSGLYIASYGSIY